MRRSSPATRVSRSRCPRSGRSFWRAPTSSTSRSPASTRARSPTRAMACAPPGARAKADATALTLRDEGGGLVLRPGAVRHRGVCAGRRFAGDAAARAPSRWRSLTSGVLCPSATTASAAATAWPAPICTGHSARRTSCARARRLAHQRRFRRPGPRRARAERAGHWVELRWNRRTDDWVVNVDARRHRRRAFATTTASSTRPACAASRPS